MAELTPYKVGRMKLAELIQLAARFGCSLDSAAKRPDYIEAINEKLRAGQAPTAPGAGPDREPGNKQLFDALTQPAGNDPSGDVCDDEPETDRRGGPRDGAGRKPGVTLEQTRLDKLPATANRTVIYVIKWLFKSWAAIADCSEIALDQDELDEFAVDTTQFLEYHGIRIPQGLAVDTKFVIGGCELVGGRFFMHKAHKSRVKAQQQQKEEASDER